MTNQNKFIIISEFGEILDLSIRLKNEGNDVLFCTLNEDYKAIGEGIIPKTTNWHECLGQGYIWLVDGCGTFSASLCDWLRSKGEIVFGTSVGAAEIENDRQLGQKLFKKMGFKQPESQNFTSIDEAISFVEENKDKRWILKQNGDAPKHLNHMGKFPGNEDMLFHLEELKQKWNVSEFGEFDCDLMEVVEGVEVAASVFFNGDDFCKNSEGKVVGFINFEHKKAVNGNLGSTTGEMGTLFNGVTEDTDIFRDIIMHDELVKELRRCNFRGVFDINGCLTEDQGFVAFEATSRFGIPSSSYEFLEGLNMPVGELIEIVATGSKKPIEIEEGLGMVMVIVAKPFPIEGEVHEQDSSLNEKLWILKNGKPIKDFTPEQRRHIHLENFQKKDGDYRVASKNGYLLTVTMSGDDIKTIREDLIQYIKDNIYLSEIFYRTDIGESYEEYFD
jgi:phosphoribosylamine--glycine ligase